MKPVWMSTGEEFALIEIILILNRKEKKTEERDININNYNIKNKQGKA